MATTFTDEEINKIIENIDRYRERVRANPKEAKRFLQSAGIHTSTGKLTKP